MAGAPPNSSWTTAFSNIGGQGSRFLGPLSSSNQYYAFLSKVDLDLTTNFYDVFFEVVAMEWVDNALLSTTVSITMPPPTSPALGFHVPQVDETTVLTVLGLKSTDDLAEGSWYLLTLLPGSSGKFVGDLYDPDIDKSGNTKLDYGPYSIGSATLLLIPQMQGQDVVLVPPTGGGTTAMVGAKRKRPGPGFYMPVAKKAAIVAAPPAPLPPGPPPPPPPPPTAAINVNDIGQGNCTMLIDQNLDVTAYYDVGYPLWFFSTSPPVTIRSGNPAYLGPILQNQNANLQVILSHWDWDHWRLGALAGLNNLPWTFPNQPMGPSAVNFLNTVGNQNQVNGGVAPFAGPGGSTIYRCAPPGPAVPAMILNNTGLALSVPMRLPVNDVNAHEVVLTGDANFNSVPLPVAVTNNVSGILAVHHGSNTHGAAANLPAAVPDSNGVATGYNAYSYGITAFGSHAYGFPVAAAVAAYQAAGWNRETSTAEGANINAGGLAGRGNIRIGNQGALNAAYNGTAFFPIVNALQ